MVDLVAGDVTLTIENKNREGKLRRYRTKVVFGDGVKTYPAGGVPLPASGSFGMVRRLDYIQLIDDNDAAGIIWKYDKENNKLRGYWPTGGAGTAPASSTSDPAVSVPSGATAVTSSAAQPNLTESPGAGKEFVGGTTTVAAQTLYVDAVGY